MRTLTCDPGAEIQGAGVRAFVDNMQSAETRPIMEKYGLQNVGPTDWIPTKTLLDALNELEAHPNVTYNLLAIGIEVGTIFPMPPDMENPTIGEVLMAWNSLYQAINRGGDAGQIHCEQVGPNRFKITLTDLFPDDFSYGIVYGYARRFLPQGTFFTVQYASDTPRRDEGGSGATIIYLEWE